MLIDFSNYIDLPLAWGILIGTAVFLYVLLDGFDLGVGIIFPFAPTDKCRDRMMNSIAPFWDANETWLVLGGGGLFAAFPVAYSILLPAFYIPIILMLLGLIMRGVAFEFRFKSTGTKLYHFWTYVFHFGSLTAGFCQGIILGSFVQGVKVNNHQFVGSALDWATSFSIMTGIAMVFGYALLGSTWLLMKTDGETQKWARKVASYTLGIVGLFMVLVSISTPFIDSRVTARWFSLPNFYYLLPVPLITVSLFFLLWRDLFRQKRNCRPFFTSIGIFCMGYLGICISIYPWIVPYQISLREAAAASPSLSLLLIGASICLPIILAYSLYCYYLFKGKADEEHIY